MTNRLASIALMLGLLIPSICPHPLEAADWSEGAFDIPDPAMGGRAGEIYLNHCSACHDRGLDRAPQRAMFTLMSPQSVYRSLSEGLMRTQAQQLSDADKAALAEFLTGRRIDDLAIALDPPRCTGAAARFDMKEPPILSGWGLTNGNTRLIRSEVAGIDSSNIGRLRLKWALGYPNATRARSQPGLAAGAVYVGSHSGTVYALDRATGCARWTFQAGGEVRTGIVISPWRSGDEHAKPKAYFGDILGNVYAVDARDGRLLWRIAADEHPNATITGTPSLHEGTLFVPVSSQEVLRASDPQYECCTFRGSVAAVDANTGAIKWQSFTIPEQPRLHDRNSVGAKQYGPSGAPVWNSPAIDSARSQLYIGTGENYSSPASGTSDSLMALDLKSGAIKWIYQATSGDAWNTSCDLPNKANCPKEHGPDFDFGAGAILATSGKGRAVVLGGQKSGVVHAVDPDTGQLLWKQRVGRGGILGGIHFGMAVNGDQVLVPINDADDGRTYAETPRPGLYALDLITGRPLWAAPARENLCNHRRFCGPGYSQAITATPELTFVGGEDGWLRIFNSANGTVVWRFDTTQSLPTVGGGKAAGGSLGGGPGPIAYRGMLFVSSGYGFAGQMPGNVLLAFGIE